MVGMLASALHITSLCGAHVRVRTLEGVDRPTRKKIIPSRRIDQVGSGTIA